MEEEGSGRELYGSQPCTPLAFDPLLPSTSRVASPARPPSTLSARQVPASPFRAQPQNMEASISRVQELREGAVGKRSYTNDWMQGSYIPPNPNQQYQRAPSVVGSTISNMSGISQMTTFSALSVNTECGNFDNWIYQSQPVLSKVSQSSVENRDPMKRRERMSISDIVQSLASTDKEIQREAIRELEPLAKQQRLEGTYGKGDLYQIFFALFEVLVRRAVETPNIIRKTLEILHYAATPKNARSFEKIFIQINKELMNPNSNHTFQVQRPSSIYELVIARASDLDTVYEQSAMLVLAQICCKPYFMKHVFSDAEALRTPGYRRLHLAVMKFTVENLKREETKPKSRGFCVSIIKNLSMRNRSIWEIVLKEGVIRIFLDIMKNEFSDEDLMWPTMQALTVFCGNIECGEVFVRLGGAQVLCGLLSHGSTRLLHELLGCMRKLSDLPAIQEQDMTESIRSVIQLVGCDDITIVERATGVLRNIGYHNKMNKAIMVQNAVTNHVIAVLRTMERFQYQMCGNVEMTRKHHLMIYENCLSILNNVTVMAPQDIKESARHACHMIENNKDSASVLLNLFNVGSRKCRKMAINVMKRVIETVPEFAEPFVDMKTNTNVPLTQLLLQRAYESLKKWREASIELMRSPQGSPQQREADEKRRDHEDIVKRSMGLLSNLCSKGNPLFFESLRAVLPSLKNPFAELSREMSDPILLEWLTFIFTICSTQWSKQNFLMYHFLMSGQITQDYLKQFQRPNKDIRDRVDAIIDLGISQQIQVNNSSHHQQQQQQEHMMMMQQQQQMAMQMAMSQHHQPPM